MFTVAPLTVAKICSITKFITALSNKNSVFLSRFSVEVINFFTNINARYSEIVSVAFWICTQCYRRRRRFNCSEQHRTSSELQAHFALSDADNVSSFAPDTTFL